MAFGMSPFPLRFGSRQGGGGGDPTAITPANADAFLASLGLTQAGTGTTWGETGQAATPLYEVAAGKVPLAVETIGGTQYFGPIVNPAGTNLALYGNDATNAAWSKNNIAPTQQTGSLNDAGAANGHSLLTATAANGTCLQAITSSSNPRVTKFWLARAAGSGTVEITQNNGSTWTAVSLTSNPQPFNTAAATLANPTIGIRIVTSGDAVRLYRTQHQVADRLLRPSIGPTAGSTVTSGARSLTRTLSGAPTSINLDIVIKTWAANPSTPVIPFSISDGTLNNYFILQSLSTAALRFVWLIGGASSVQNITLPTDAAGLISISWSGTGFNYSLNGVAQTPLVKTLGTYNRIGIGCGNLDSVTQQSEQPVLAIRDNAQNLLAAAPYGWNHPVLENWA